MDASIAEEGIIGPWQGGDKLTSRELTSRELTPPDPQETSPGNGAEDIPPALQYRGGGGRNPVQGASPDRPAHVAPLPDAARRRLAVVTKEKADNACTFLGSFPGCFSVNTDHLPPGSRTNVGRNGQRGSEAVLQGAIASTTVVGARRV